MKYIVYYKKSARGKKEYSIQVEASNAADARYNFRLKHMRWTVTHVREKGRSDKR